MWRRFDTRRPGTAVLLGVAAFHVLLGLALLGVRAPADRRAAPVQPPLVVRLLALEPVLRLPQSAAPKPAPAPAVAPRPVLPGPSPLRNEPQAITLPALPASSSPLAAPAPPAATANAPLLLDLPRAASSPDRWRNPALSDPRSNTARRTLESSISAVMGGDDRLTEEVFPDGRIRYRRGADCIMVHPSRADQLDGFNQSARPTPRAVGPC